MKSYAPHMISHRSIWNANIILIAYGVLTCTLPYCYVRQPHCVNAQHCRQWVWTKLHTRLTIESYIVHATTIHYTLGTHPVTGTGLEVSDEQLDEALSGSVSEIVFDDAGKEAVAHLLDGLAETEFAQENLDTLLSSPHPPEDWRVGEALAESYLSASQDCFFPWPDSRDERKRGSSLPGADLVGFQQESDGDRFAFGEVKTSSEASYPPGAAYGRHGLKKQIEDLRDSQEIRNGLVLYLGHRAENTHWQDRFRSAAARYLRNTCDVRIFGILVRDVLPHEDDLRTRVQALLPDCPDQMVIKLIAIYLPQNSIATLSERVVSQRENGGAT